MNTTTNHAPQVGAPFSLLLISDAVSVEFNKTAEEIKTEIFLRQLAQGMQNPKDFDEKTYLSLAYWTENTLAELLEYVGSHSTREAIQFVGATVEMPETWKPVYNREGQFFGTYRRDARAELKPNAPQPKPEKRARKYKSVNHQFLDELSKEFRKLKASAEETK